MSRALSFALMAAATVTFAGCHGNYAVRPIPRIAADSVGKPIGRLQEAFGQPRKIDTTPTKEVYVWFLAQTPDGAPAGFHGCEMEVTVGAGGGGGATEVNWSAVTVALRGSPVRSDISPKKSPGLRRARTTALASATAPPLATRTRPRSITNSESPSSPS